MLIPVILSEAKNLSKKMQKFSEKIWQSKKCSYLCNPASRKSGILYALTGHKKFIEKTERKVQSKYKRASVSLEKLKRQGQAKHYKYTMKSLILAQDER